MTRRGWVAVVSLAVLLALPRSARAADESDAIWQRDTLTGDWGGARNWLVDRGVSFSFNYIGETLANPSGGVSHSAIYEGRLELTTEIDLGQLAGWTGALFHATGYQIHGHGLSRAIDDLPIPSNIEARPSTRLFTLWIEQGLFSGSASLRIGQLAADDEFIVSATSAMFVNSTFGWPAFAGTNLPSGGPAYPLAAPGARLRVDPVPNLSILAAIFSGDPAGTPSALDPQLRDASGTLFSFSGGSFYIGEAQYAINQGENASGLPGTYKLGAWYHTGSFGDERFDSTARSLASPTSSGVPLQHHGDYAIYAVADQTVWQANERAIDLFLRIGGLPSDRNLLAFYLDAGAAYTGPFAGRPEDKLGIAFAYVPIGNRARELDRDAIAVTGTGFVRDSESVLELSYQAKLAPWWILQPDLQFVFHPGGTIANPRAPSTAVGDAVVIGLRTMLKL